MAKSLREQRRGELLALITDNGTRTRKAGIEMAAAMLGRSESAIEAWLKPAGVGNSNPIDEALLELLKIKLNQHPDYARVSRSITGMRGKRASRG